MPCSASPFVAGVDRVQLLDHRQRGAFVLADQCAFSHQRPLHGGLAGDDGYRGLAGIGASVIVFLGADGIGLDQFRVTLLLQYRLQSDGLGLAQLGFGTVQVGLERGRIDAKEDFALLDVTTLAEGALQYHALDTGSHLRATRGGDALAELTVNRQGLALNGFDAYAGQGCRLFFV